MIKLALVAALAYLCARLLRWPRPRRSSPATRGTDGSRLDRSKIVDADFTEIDADDPGPA
ncbi:MAG: hypothetical protein ABIL09_15155 [Gemmatimonadota bacterium]